MIPRSERDRDHGRSKYCRRDVSGNFMNVRLLGISQATDLATEDRRDNHAYHINPGECLMNGCCT